MDVSGTSLTSVRSNCSFLSTRSDGQNPHLIRAVEFLHEDKEFLIAAEIGNDKMLQILIRKGVDIQQRDHLGRNALHLAVCTDSEQALLLLLNAGVFTNLKDNVGMTPLSLCLMRRPSLKVVSLLFDHGAKLLPRTSPMDTGLFLQFVMMSTPTEEEVKILQLLTTKGALINDPESPGGRQGLHFAAMSDNCELIHVLVDLGADLFLVNHRNQTPKEVAFTFKCRKAYSLLNQLEALNRESITTNTTLKVTTATSTN
ncbi:unnamed protein product [Parnassius mnemosyne]|uniref:Uncharacterized protein n=1 Tax=Parnassius mnemosyne TaxID=213953 RepID=A0AAV1KVJ3_9NEOP